MSCLDPAQLLLLAYEEADLFAAIHFQALRTQTYPLCLCQSGALNAFRRRFKRFSHF